MFPMERVMDTLNNQCANQTIKVNYREIYLFIFFFKKTWIGMFFSYKNAQFKINKTSLSFLKF